MPYLAHPWLRLCLVYCAQVIYIRDAAWVGVTYVVWYVFATRSQNEPYREIIVTILSVAHDTGDASIKVVANIPITNY